MRKERERIIRITLHEIVFVKNYAVSRAVYNFILEQAALTPRRFLIFVFLAPLPPFSQRGGYFSNNIFGLRPSSSFLKMIVARLGFRGKQK